MKEEGLKREIGVRALALNSINLTIGSGIFVLPAIVSQHAGPAGIYAYLICGATVLLALLCYAELGSKITTSGGGFAYIESVLGPYWGFISSLLIVVGFASSADAAIAIALVNTLAIWFKFLSEPVYRTIFIVLLFGIFAYINVRGVKQGVRFVEIITIAKLIPLVLIMLAGWITVDGSNLVVKEWPSAENFGEVSLILFFAFIGIDSALSNSGEIKNPAYTIPRGLFFGVLGILIIYVTIQAVATGVLGAALADFTDAPLIEVASRALGPVGITILLIGTVLSMAGTIGGDQLASPRVLFGAARQRLLPFFLGKVHPVFKTPYWSIIVFATITCLMAVTGAFKTLAIFASTSVLIVYLLVCISTIKNRIVNGKPDPGLFTLPGGITIPIMACGVVVWLLSHLSLKELSSMAVFILFLSVVYYLTNYFRKKHERAEGQTS
ncbi:MAG: amino acid permease [Flammeovirgaceae bacterium]|nr:amino acid permease [Flammeovirgaceae bacterium]